MWEGKEQGAAAFAKASAFVKTSARQVGAPRRAEDRGQIAAGRLQQAAFQLGTRHFFQRPVEKKSGAEAPQFFLLKSMFF